MGKPKGKNGFFQYLLHTQRELRSEGKNYTVNDRTLQELAGAKWKDMSKEEREPFEHKSRRAEERNKTIPIQPKSYTQRQENFGRVLSQESHVIDDESGREEYYDKMIECCVKACTTRDELLNASFFVIGSNVMMKTDDNKYYPMEIGICPYSIAEGIKYTYHEFIDPGKVPLGYMSRAKSWCEDTHRIPMENFLKASNSYEKIVVDIKTILDSSRFTNEMTRKPTPMLVFCREDQIEQNKGVLDWLAAKYKASEPSFDWDYEVLDIVTLLYYISKSVGKPIAPAYGESLMTTSAFDWSPNTNCDFHEERDNMHCAQGLARRLCYMLSQSLCPMFDINPTEKHLPPKREGIIAETYRANLQEVRPTAGNRYHHNPNADDEWEPKDEESDPSTSRPQSRTPLMGIGRGRGVPRSTPGLQKR